MFDLDRAAPARENLPHSALLPLLQTHRYLPPPTPSQLGLVEPFPAGQRLSGAGLTKMRKFRFPLLSNWIVKTFPPCSVADVGGGKGLLAHLLTQSGFEATLIDPTPQLLPTRYRELATGERVRIPNLAFPDRINQPFSADIGSQFDLLVALHAHAVNFAVLDCVKTHHNSCVILPCCVIGEPSAPPPGQNWFMWLVEYAKELGLTPEFFQLGFKGQNLGLYIRGNRPSNSTKA